MPLGPSVWLVDALYRNGAVLLSMGIVRRIPGARLAVLRRLPRAEEVDVLPGVGVVPLGGEERRFSRLAVPALVRLLRQVRHAHVVVNCSEIGMGLLISFAAARLARRTFVVAVHADLDDALDEWTSKRQHWLYRWVHRHVDGAICVAPALAEPLVRNGLTRDRIRVIRNGVDTEEIRRRAAATPLGASLTSLPVVVATGRVARQKAYDVLVQAHATVVRDIPHRLQVHNDGPELGTIRRLVVDLGVEASVEFVDPTLDPLPHVGRAALFCLPSRHEGLPLSLLEAVTLGVPCLATTSSEGVSFALDHGRVGDLVPVDDVAALAAALRGHLSDARPLLAKAAAGPAHSSNFDIEAMTRSWSEALCEISERSRPAPARR